MSERKFDAFADDRTVVTVGGLTLQNGLSEVAVFGDAVFKRDSASLPGLKLLIESLAGVVAAIEASPEPLEADIIVAVEEVENPF